MIIISARLFKASIKVILRWNLYYDDVDIRSLEPLVQFALHESALRTAEAILVPKIEHLTASILKNPFTMSNTGRLDPITVLSHGEPFLFISRISGLV